MSLLNRIFQINNFEPSNECLQTLAINFEGACNIEWFDRETFVEALFYKDNLEHIAILDTQGVLMEYRLNLPETCLPESIKVHAESKGEVMNSVMRNKGNKIEYEIIVRDTLLNRYLLTFSDIGKLLEEKGL